MLFITYQLLLMKKTTDELKQLALDSFPVSSDPKGREDPCLANMPNLLTILVSLVHIFHLQVTAVVKYWLGGPDPLDYISMFANPGSIGLCPSGIVCCLNEQ